MDTNYRPNEPAAGDGVVVDTTRARQGVTGHNVRYVLGFGLAGVVIVFAIGYLAVRGYFGV